VVMIMFHGWEIFLDNYFNFGKILFYHHKLRGQLTRAMGCYPHQKKIRDPMFIFQFGTEVHSTQRLKGNGNNRLLKRSSSD
jgi:hypothetical protein